MNLLSIRSLAGSQHFAFEELCCQLAAIESRRPGVDYFRKGLGADAGVECFIRFPNGEEQGWQAKFFDKFTDAQCSQLTKSFETALEKHPKLATYIVCIPIDLRDSRTGKAVTELKRWEKWRASQIAKSENLGRKIEIVLQQATDTRERLARSDPFYSGRLAYFFEETSFSSSWFANQLENTKSALGSRYSPEFHVSLPIRQAFFGIARTDELENKLDELCERIEQASYEHLNHSNIGMDDRYRTGAGEATIALTSAMRKRVEFDANYPVDAWLRLLGDLEGLLRTYIRECWRHGEAASGSDKEKSDRRDSVRYRVSSIYKLLDVADDLRESLQNPMWRTANSRATLIAGDAGTGKSHLLADVATDTLSNGCPAILLMTSLFSQQDPRTQILERLDLRSMPFSTFLGALDASGQAAGVRALLMIDALNERHGIELWREHLAPLISEISRFPHIALVVTCRTTYVDALLNRESALNDLVTRIDHHGFTDGGGRAARAYLAKRGIVRPSAPNLSPEFNNPLFLKTCCDALQKDGLTAFPKGVQSITQLLEFYLDASVRRIEERMDLDSRQKIVSKAIEAFAGRLVAITSAYLDVETAIALFEEILPSKGMGKFSLLTQLEHEGLLTVELVYSDETNELEEQVRFTFERISDFRVASSVLRDQPYPIAVPAEVGTPLHAILSSNRMYRFGGILEALAVILPEEHGIELPDLAPGNTIRHAITRAFFESLLLRRQSDFTDRTKTLVDYLSNPEEFRWLQALIAVATEPLNKFNADYIHSRLSQLSMIQRDAAWSVDLADLGNEEDGHLDILLGWALESGDSAHDCIDEERARLTGLILSWLLTTSHRVIRDQATKSLASFLRLRLQLAIYLLKEFDQINDPYVTERLLASIYGAVLQAADLEGIGRVAEEVYSQFFIGRNPPPHLLARDYARGIIGYAKYREVLSPDIDLTQIQPPFKSEWPIEYVSDADLEKYRVERNGVSIRDEITLSASSEWTGDFAKYVISPAVGCWSATTIAEGQPENDVAAYLSAWLDALETIGNDAALASALKIITFCSQIQARDYADELLRDEKEPPITIGGVKIRARSVSDDYWKKKRADDKRYEEIEGQLLAYLSPAHRYEYQTKLRHYLNGIRFGNFRSRSLRFDETLAQRWVTVRAHELGWNRELVGDFDSRIGTGRGRPNKHVERIGKKYQWIALHELLARMSDSLVFNTYDGPQPFEGSWQTYLRDIDPSLLLKNTKHDGWRVQSNCWWSHSRLKLSHVAREDQDEWLETDQDQLNGIDMLDVVQPGGRRWLVLRGFQFHGTPSRCGSHVDSWSRVWSLLVRKNQAKQLIEALAENSLVDPRALPDAPFHDQMFLAEHPWHSAICGDDWQKLERQRGFQGKVLPLVAEYTASARSYDRSLTESFDLHLPGRWLMKNMGLQLIDGRNPRYAGSDGQIAFQDPSISEAGPSAALVDKEKFLAALAANDLTIVWVVAGEKGAYGSNEQDFVGRRSHSFVYRIDAQGKIECARNFVLIERPGSREVVSQAAYQDTSAPARGAKSPVQDRATKLQKAARTKKGK